jgi:hypothetical protein
MGRGCTGSYKRITKKMRERHAAELHKWGSPEGGMAEQLALTEACAEAGWSTSCQSSLLPKALSYADFRATSHRVLLQTKNKQLFPVCISDDSTN